MIGCGLLLRPIIIEPLKEGEEPESRPLKPPPTALELENQPTRTSISSQDSGVTSLSTSTGDLRPAAADHEAGRGGRDEEVDAAPVGSELLDFSALKDRAFVCYSLFGLFATLGFFAPQLYIIELSKIHRLSIGALLNRVRCRKMLVLLGCVVLLCLVLVAFTVVWEFWGLVVCCALYGYFMGTVGSTHIPMLAEEEVVGIRKMPSSVGVYVFIQSFAGLAGPPLGGTGLGFFSRSPPTPDP